MVGWEGLVKVEVKVCQKMVIGGDGDMVYIWWGVRLTENSESGAEIKDYVTERSEPSLACG